jgi:hypothetical protein
MFCEAVHLAGHQSTWQQSGPVSITGTNASAGVFVAHGATWRQESSVAINISALHQREGTVGVRLVGGVWEQRASTSIELNCLSDHTTASDCDKINNRWEGRRSCSLACTGMKRSPMLMLVVLMPAALLMLNRNTHTHTHTRRGAGAFVDDRVSLGSRRLLGHQPLWYQRNRYRPPIYPVILNNTRSTHCTLHTHPISSTWRHWDGQQMCAARD